MKKLYEVLDVEGITKTNKMGAEKDLGKSVPEDARFLSDMPSGHSVYRKKQVINQYGRSSSMQVTGRTLINHYYVADSTGKVSVKMETQQKFDMDKSKFDKGEEIDKVASDSSNPDRPGAHELYHHLITHHDKMLTSFAQSPGGRKVWKKLSGMKNINVHGWDTEQNKPVNIDMKSDDYEHEIYASHKDKKAAKEEGGGVKNKEYQGVSAVMNMNVVAHRKTKPKTAVEGRQLKTLGDILNEAQKKKHRACCSACAAAAEGKNLDEELIIMEAEYHGKTVTLNKPFRTSGARKKFGVYTMGPNGNVVMVRFGDPNLSIKRDNPERRKNFRARHKCDTDRGPKWKARYWSCHQWRAGAKVED